MKFIEDGYLLFCAEYCQTSVEEALSNDYAQGVCPAGIAPTLHGFRSLWLLGALWKAPCQK